MKRLVIIPAREGSKRIPHKNIKDFCGKPMVSHAIKACEKSGVFQTIHVSSDSHKVAAVAEQYGHKPAFLRPAGISGDHATMMEVIRYTVEELELGGEIFHTVALVYATSPLVSPDDLKRACDAFEKGDLGKPLLAVVPYPAPVEHAFRMEKDGAVLTPDNKDALAMRTQDLKPAYYDAGMFAFYTPAFIKKQKAGGDFTAFRGFAVPSYRVTDIDWPEDWQRAEMLFKAVSA